VTVLYFADTRFPIERANGVQTMATCWALAERGHAVTLVVRPDTAPLPRDPFEFYGWPANPRLDVVPVPTSRGPRRRRIRYLLDALRRSRAQPDSVVYTRDLGLAAFLLQLPADRRPRLVYESHGVATTVSEEMPRLLGKPELAPSARKLRRLDRQERRVWARAPAYVTITRALADDLAGRYGPRPNLFVVPDGAGSGRAWRKPGLTPESPPAYPSADSPASLRQEPGVRPGLRQARPDPSVTGVSIIAAYAGHLYPWKGVDVFVRALALAPDVRGLIVGGHPGETDRARVESLARELGLGGRLTITGLVPPHEVRQRLAVADVLVLPNTLSAISERYTSPLKLFEYLTLGRPIVASDLPAVREILTDGVTALLSPPGDAHALAAALERLAGDAALARALGEAAAALADEYTWERRAARLEPALAAAARASHS
jgi:glycosyltransferase involved in cell wall biosynthesis